MTTRSPAGRAARGGLTSAALPDPLDYSATSVRLTGPDATVDPLALAADDGVLVAGRTLTIAGRGVAAVLELPDGLENPAALREAVDWLRAVGHESPRHVTPGPPASGVDWEPNGRGGGRVPPSPGVVALGAFPFNRDAPAFLVVPSVAWCQSADGRTWRVTVDGPDDVHPSTARAQRGGVAPARPPVRRSPTPATSAPASPSGLPWPAPAGVLSLVEQPRGADYAAMVATALKEIAAGRLAKVVLSRAVEVVLRDAPRPSAVLGALWDGDPAFSPFSLPVPGGRLVGASPELIVSRMGRAVTSHPFAGTISLGALGGDDPAERLFASQKDRNEHRLLVEEIATALRPYCAELDVPAAPSVVPLRSDARLGSLIHGTLRRLRPLAAQGAPSEPARSAAGQATDRDGAEATALDLLAVLHPTPAVGGVPRAAALDAIASLEPTPRGYWAGVTGWVDGDGDGEWVLAIRSVLLDRHHALVRAGAGIVDGSDPTTELAETTFKLSPVLDALSPTSSGLV